MRTLSFNVKRQHITKDKNCDFSHLVAGSVGYLRASFKFDTGDPSWFGCIKAASFWKDGVEYAVVLDRDNSCDIPDVVLTGRRFYVSVTGLRPSEDRYIITTNKYRVIQGVC